jgi:hypothetical protein
VGQNKLPKWAKIRLFRKFDATQGEAPAAIADEYGKTRARSSSKPARPYIWRLIILRRLIWPSTWPVLQDVSTAAANCRGTLERALPGSHFKKDHAERRVRGHVSERRAWPIRAITAPGTFP